MEENKFNIYSLTLDIDWAPDFAIENAAMPLIENKIKCTWFVTHLSPYIKKLFRHTDIFEFGIHPNFFPGSSHGKTETEVLKYICSIVPHSKVVRSHALLQSSRLLSAMSEEFGIETDANLLLYLTPDISPHKIYFKHNSEGIVRIPFFWEDDIAMYDPCITRNIESPVYHPNGIKIFNFHPILVYLNSTSMHSYEKLKTIASMNELSREEVLPYVNTDNQSGTGVFFNNLILYLKEKKITTYTMTEIRNLYENKFDNNKTKKDNNPESGNSKIVLKKLK
jgi:Polysaccharide deacetylase